MAPFRRLWSIRWLQLSIAAALLLVGLLLFTCWRLGVWSLRDWEIYQAMRNECHPVWRELQAGRVYRGQPVDEVIARTDPIRVTSFENCAILEYQTHRCFTGITIIAEDGKLVSARAWSCTWDRVFFEAWSPARQREFWERYNAGGRAASAPNG